MKKSVLFSMILFPILVFGQEIITSSKKELISPGGDYKFTFFQREHGSENMTLHYIVEFKGKIIIEESELGVEISNQLFESALAVPNDECKYWCENLKLIDTQRAEYDRTWYPVYGERAVVRDRYNEMVLNLRKGSMEGDSQTSYDRRKVYNMDIQVRAYDEGIAFRYHFPETVNGLFIHINGERTSFTIPEGALAYFENWAQGPYEVRELKNWNNEESERPLTLKLPDGVHVALTEANMTDYARAKFRLSDCRNSTLETSLYSNVDIITPYDTPWRVIMAGEKAVDLINNNDLILNLNPECEIENTTWIKPGKVFRSGLKHEEVIAAIDFAAEQNIDYVHMDAGWYGPEMKVSSDACTVAENRDLEMKTLCDYARSKGIGLFVYVNQRALFQQLDKVLPLYKEWGLKGIKFGFVQIGNQYWSSWLHNAVKKCADYEIMLDIHDEYRPTGFSRTYPNLMTQEGIRGNEEMPDAQHNTILPFTRMIAGAADYTLCYFSNRVKNTKAHQLAMAAVYYSPLQFLYWYDSPSLYRGEQELEFWKAIPSVWDDSKALDGEIGEFIIQARRAGEEWFVGAMTNTESRTVTINTDFLEIGKKYNLALYEDDLSLETRTKVRTTYKKIKAGDKVKLTLLPSGGAALHFIPVR